MGRNDIDVNKTTPVDPDGTPPGPGDAYLDWAATAAEMLQYTGWGAVNGLTSSAAIFQYFKAHFNDYPGLASAGLDWWFDGQNDLAGVQGASQVTSAGGDFYPGLIDANYVLQQTNTASTMTSLDQYLRAATCCPVALLDTPPALDSSRCGDSPSIRTIQTTTPACTSPTELQPTNPSTGAPQLSFYAVNLYQVNNVLYWGLPNYSGSNPWLILNATALLSKTPGVAQPVVSTDIGINVVNNASPTILNNVVANLGTGIQVDATSATTVVGCTAYQGNTTTLTGVNNVTNNTFPMYLQPGDPLFVDAAAGNFYPAEGSSIIDSAEDSLDDRPNMITVRTPLGIPPSPILAPDRDMFGQLRSDDPSVSPPPGQGETTYKDRGAIDRVDFDGPTAALADPVDNDNAGMDRNPALNEVTIAMVGATAFPDFAVQLDDAGAGIADNTVTADTVEVFQNGNLLTSGRDYFFSYDSDESYHYAAAGHRRLGARQHVYDHFDRRH